MRRYFNYAGRWMENNLSPSIVDLETINIERMRADEKSPSGVTARFLGNIQMILFTRIS